MCRSRHRPSRTGSNTHCQHRTRSAAGDPVIHHRTSSTVLVGVSSTCHSASFVSDHTGNTGGGNGSRPTFSTVFQTNVAEGGGRDGVEVRLGFLETLFESHVVCRGDFVFESTGAGAVVDAANRVVS